MLLFTFTNHSCFEMAGPSHCCLPRAYWRSIYGKTKLVCWESWPSKWCILQGVHRPQCESFNDPELIFFAEPVEQFERPNCLPILTIPLCTMWCALKFIFYSNLNPQFQKLEMPSAVPKTTSEEIFLSQLHSRSQLLNKRFQALCLQKKHPLLFP